MHQISEHGEAGSPDSHGGDGVLHASLAVGRGALHVRVRQMHAVVHAEADENDGGNGLGDVQAPAHDEAAPDSQHRHHDASDGNDGDQGQDEVSGGEHQHRKRNGKSNTHSVDHDIHQGLHGESPHPRVRHLEHLVGRRRAGLVVVPLVLELFPLLLARGNESVRLQNIAMQGLELGSFLGNFTTAGSPDVLKLPMPYKVNINHLQHDLEGS